MTCAHSHMSDQSVLFSLPVQKDGEQLLSFRGEHWHHTLITVLRQSFFYLMGKETAR